MVQKMGVDTVLIAEDDARVRAYVSEVLKQSGFAVLEAADGTAALRIAETTRPFEILVTDINMPGINGLELARRVRAIRPATGVVYMSGGPPDVVAAWCLATVATVFLAKPFAPDALLEHVREALQRSANEIDAGP